MHDIIQGNCLEVLTQLEDNSIDAIVTDPPYELGFMGKSWDNTGIANNPLMWAECLRVLKPGGHLLAFSGTRTYHRMAVAIEDAGFEVRDMIEWIYSTGFPKSLNIGKAVDKLQGNEREVLGTKDLKRGSSIADQTTDKSVTGWNKPDYPSIVKITKGNSQYEGWGTALKPAHEPICMARKPLGNSELDIAKNICYNITEKGLITNSKIIWRIKNVKSAEKQKMSNYSTPTQLQKTVVVSAEFVETKENESVGKKIQKLIDSICESGIQETGNKPEKQVLKAISKTRTEYQDTGENINTNEKQKPLKHTEENASVVENQDLSSLPLTTLEAEEDSTEKKSKTETSMSSLKSTDTQKTDIDCSVATATSQWVCMDIVRTLKVSFEGKEYDFIELTDGSLVWNENLEPYRKQQKLNVAENCLKWGTGGINIDESRVEGEMGADRALGKPRIDTDKYGKANPTLNPQSPLGRFPANLLHDNSEEVRECFPETKTGAVKTTVDNGANQPINLGGGLTKERLADSGNASRFFKGIPQVVDLHDFSIYNRSILTNIKQLCGQHLTKKKTGIMLDGVIQEVEKFIQDAELLMSGNSTTIEKFLTDTAFITKTLIAQMTELKTLNVLPNWLIMRFTEESEKTISLLKELNTEDVKSAKSIFLLQTFISEVLESIRAIAEIVAEQDSSNGDYKSLIYQAKASKSERNKGCEELGTSKKFTAGNYSQSPTCKDCNLTLNGTNDHSECSGEVYYKEMESKNTKNNHPTVKPIALMEYLIKMVTPKGGIVLDPFAGSGSTLVAAKQNGFQYVGIELDKDYCIIAESRLKQKTLKQEVLF